MFATIKVNRTEGWCEVFEQLEKINERPEVFGEYSADALWTDEYRSQQMLRYHLDGSVDVSSRKAEFISQSSKWIIDRFDLGEGRAVCDFGCGPGLYTSRLAQSGARVTGVDFSYNSIEYARQQAKCAGQKINYVHGNYLDFATDERFDLITMIMCDFCALSPMQRRQLLAIWHAHLSDAGAVLFDVYSMVAYAEREAASCCEKNQLDHFWHAEEYYAFVNTFKYDAEAVVLDKYSIFPERSRAETVYNWLQYFSPEGLTQELREAGFNVEQLFGNVAGAVFSDVESEFAIVATINP